MLSTYNREDSPQNLSSYSPSLHHTKENKTIYFTRDGDDDYIYPNKIIINSLDISDGLIGVARIIRSAARKLPNCSYRI